MVSFCFPVAYDRKSPTVPCSAYYKCVAITQSVVTAKETEPELELGLELELQLDLELDPKPGGA